MKLVILLLVIIGACYAQTNVTYVELTPNQYAEDAVIVSLRDYGIQNVLAQAVKSGQIADNNFQLFAVNHIYRGPANRITYYKYDLSLKNALGDVLTANFVIQYTLRTGAKLIYSSSYALKYAQRPSNNTTSTGTGAAAAANNFLPLPEDQYDTDLILRLAEYGKNAVLTQALARGRLPAGDYGQAQIVGVYYQTLSNGANYKFEIYFEKNDFTREVEANFSIRYQSSPEKMTITASSFSVLPYKTS